MKSVSVNSYLGCREYHRYHHPDLVGKKNNYADEKCAIAMAFVTRKDHDWSELIFPPLIVVGLRILTVFIIDSVTIRIHLCKREEQGMGI